MHPTIYDGYPGELQLTEVELPPSIPETPFGQIIGNTNTTYNYSTVSVDPEGDRIRYGWDWDSDHIVNDWSDFVESGISANISLSWSIEGTYNLQVKAVDEYGVESEWSNLTVVSMSSDNIPDQRQTILGGGIYLGNQWVAQSFVPTLNSLSKVELAIESWGTGDPPLIPFYIRDSLNGENLAESFLGVPPTEFGISKWTTFDFEDLNIIPGNTYYIIVEKVGFWGYSWSGGDLDSYLLGEFFISNNGSNWESFPGDGCFVTWGEI